MDEADRMIEKMSQSEIVKRIEEICNEFDARLKIVGVAIARLELAKALAEYEAAQSSAQLKCAECGALGYSHMPICSKFGSYVTQT